jgi:hypothetical protein
MLVKNTFGCCITPNPKLINPDWINEFRGSSLDRKPKVNDAVKKQKKEPKEKQLRSLSTRTKTKVRRKIIALAGVVKKFSFLTLTFVNKVDDALAIKMLGQFLDTIKKQDINFQYLWVAERQTQNIIFEGNVHFHLIGTKYWKIEKHWKYWLGVQGKNGIVARDQKFNPTSAFDVKGLTSKNTKGVLNYVTKYITKNESQFRFAPWNCSKKISQLYTSYYSDFSTIKQLEKLEADKLIRLKRYKEDFCNILVYPYNKTTSHFCDKVHEKNKSIWNNQILNTDSK